MRYKTKPVEIEAYEWTGGNDVLTWAKNVSDGNGTSLAYAKDSKGETLVVYTLEGMMRAKRGDFVICGLHGEFYFCKPAMFHAKYEVIE
jgi:hypothetical protein